ncbi:extracellular solute-binding protein [Paenibacillus contaminans]|uniref:ABC transporter substrate-binding protein n=1 Tax=Paenibacillus contaminans TaxID=450362 RepID=A0A329MNX8_9BACL|nr:extracellular solute-binding protein [Paenibacillus contaminans]RAV21332.1 ABC transporter substrate-binding protein [Paenibacillus contaminans]
MKRKTKGMVALLVGAGALVAGCSGGGTKETASPSPAQTAAASASPTATPKKDPVKFSVFIPGSGGNPAPDKDPILQQLNKDLNMQMDFNIGVQEYNQVLNTKIAGGTPPDVFGVVKTNIQTFAKQGVLLELDKYLDKLPNLKKTYTDTDWNKGKVDGKLYGIAKRPDIPMTSYWIRADWLKKLNLETPKTVEEFKKVLQAFTEQDPDGNGKKDTFGLTGADLPAFSALFTAFGVADPGHYMIRDNKVVYSTTDPATKQALTYIADLIASGAVDPEIMTNKNPIEKAFKGQAGVIYIGWPSIATDATKETYKKINPNAEWVQLDALTGPGGKYQGIWDVGRNPAMIALSKSLEKQPEKLDKILEYINYITEPGKGQLTVNYGVEGTHYKMENGKAVALPAMSETAYAWQVQLTGRNEMDYLKTKFPKQEKEIDFAKNQPRILVYSEFVPLPEQVVVDERYEYEELVKFLYSKRPLSDFDEYVKTLNSKFNLPARLQQAEKTLKDLGYVK